MTVINSNISALKAQANIAKNESKLNSAMERLSTGTRINAAKDDAAGLAISTKMTSQINGLNQAIRNANDGLSMVSTIEASLSQTTNVLQRMRELAVQSASDSNSVSDRQFIQSEIVQMNSELDRIASQSRYNGLKVLDGSFINQKLQIGANGGETLSFNVGAADSNSIGNFQYRADSGVGAVTAAATIPANPVSTAQNLAITGELGTVTGLSVSGSAYSIASVVNGKTSSTGVTATATTKAIINNLGANGTVSFSVLGKNQSGITISATVTTSDLTALADAFNSTSSQTGITAAISASKSAILLTSADGYDIQLGSFTTTNATKTVDVTGMKSTATADSSTTGTDIISATANITSANVATRVIGDVTFAGNRAFTVTSSTGTAGSAFVASTTLVGGLNAMSTISLATQTGASNSLSIIDGAIAKVSAMRGDLGAISSRLEKTVDALTASSTNTSAARSRILDADYSLETTNLSKAQIIAQASNAMLAQANQQPQLVLSLLK